MERAALYLIKDKSDDLRNTSLLRSESKNGESMNPYLVA
jgi:hypothetical protein